jgi:hypothetical protein
MGVNIIQKAFYATMSLMFAAVVVMGSSDVFYASSFNESAPEVQSMEIEINSEEEIIEEKSNFKGSDYISFNVSDASIDVDECANIAEGALESFSEFLDGFEFVNIHDDLSLRRGLSNGPQIYMLCLEDSEEFLNVLIHELGHTVDLMYMEGTSSQGKSGFMDFSDPVWYNDPSVRYYKMSWEDESTLKDAADRSDFVSGYAMTDPFEDFAETFAMYVQFGEVFRYIIDNGDSNTLRNKYLYMKYTVFDGKEFGLDKEASFEAVRMFRSGSSDLFDVTKLHNLV